MMRAAPLLVRAIWLLIFAVGAAWAVYVVATLVFSSPPLPQHATVTIASTGESYGTPRAWRGSGRNDRCV